MFRIVTKIPKNDLSRTYQNGSIRLCKNVRQYSKDKEKELCPPATPKSGGTGTIYTIGALALLSGGTIGFAKYNPEFRDWLMEQAPFTDSVIKFVFQEEKTFYQSLISSLENMKNLLLSLISSEKSVSKKQIKGDKDYYPPSPAFKDLASVPKEDSYTEIRLEKKIEPTKDIMVEIAGDPKEMEQIVRAFDPSNLVDLETKIGLAVSTAIKSLHEAKYAILNYNNDVEAVLEESTHKLNPSVWNSIQEKGKLKSEALKQADAAEAEANANIKKLRELLNKKDLKAPADVVDRAKLNIQLLVEDLAKAKREFEIEMKSSDLTNKYWNKVKESREFFAKELEILFPDMNLDQQKLQIKEGDLDLFLMHAVTKVLHYQKQIAELETIQDAKLKSAIAQAKSSGNFELLTTEQLCIELEKAKRQLELEYHDKCLKLKHDGETELRHKLKVQSQAFADHLADALKIREEELKRMIGRDFDEKLTEERCRFKAQVAAMVGRLKGMDDAFKARADADKMAHNAQVLWSACQALYRSLKSGCPGRDWKEQIKPLKPELTAVEKAAAKEDELVKVVLNGIPQIARDRGVYPEDALRERFLKVEKVARTLSLVPEQGARFHIYILSYIQSLLLIKAASPIPQAELNDEPVEFKTLSTNEILQRARYWMDRGDFMQTLKYMSLLKGASRVIASQWMEETRLMLETQQAANTLMAHAAASGLLYL